jgi:hypothetical protein
MSVIKSAPSTTELLAEYLSGSPTPRLVDAFLADLRVLNRRLLADSILEAQGTTSFKTPLSYDEKRQFIHKIYTRKTKELAALYPVIFAVENALRSALSVHLTTYFDRRDWWVVVRDAVIAGKSYQDFDHICGKQVSYGFKSQIFFTVEKILDGPNKGKLLAPTNDDQLFLLLTIGQLQRIIVSDWLFIRQMFRQSHEIRFHLNKTNFQTRLKSLKDARDEVFHSNPIRNRSHVFTAAEDILDALDFHLGDFDKDLKDAEHKRFEAVAPRELRHLLPARPFPKLMPN